MLVLSRRESETIEIPELDITIEVVRVQGNSVRIGIEAPKEIRIVRGEVAAKDDLDHSDTNTIASVTCSTANPQPVVFEKNRMSAKKSRPLAAYVSKTKSTVREDKSGYVVDSILSC